MQNNKMVKIKTKKHKKSCQKRGAGVLSAILFYTTGAWSNGYDKGFQNL